MGKEDPDITIRFADNSPKNDRKFDGRGGMLAEASAKHLYFDKSETWRVSSNAEAKRGTGRTFLVHNVALHEVGHVIGLGHDRNPNAVMAPYYSEDKVKLTDSDVANAKALYTVE